MTDKQFKYISYLETFTLPPFITHRLINKIGITDYLNYKFDKIGVLFQTSNKFFIHAYKANPEETINYINNLNPTIPEDMTVLRKILSLNYFEKFHEYVSFDKIRVILLSSSLYDSEVKTILKYYGDDVDTFIQDDIKNNRYMRYFELSVADSLRNRLFEFLDIPSIIDVLEKKKLYSSNIEQLFKIKGSEIETYIYNNIEKNNDLLFSYLEYGLPEYVLDNLTKYMKFDDTFFKKVYIDSNNSKMQEYIFKIKEKESYEYVDNVLKGPEPLSIFTYYIPEKLVEYALLKLDINQVEALLKKDFVPSSISTKFYKLREKDITSLILNTLGTSVLDAIKLLDLIRENELQDKILKNININDDVIRDILDHNNDRYINPLYKLKKDLVVNYFLDKRYTDPDFFVQSFEYNFNTKLVRDITDNLTDDELIIIFSNYRFGRDNKDDVFSRYHDRFINLFNSIAKYDSTKAKNMLADSGGTKFREYVVDNFDLRWLINNDVLYTNEQDKFFNKRHSEMTFVLNELFNTDKYELFKVHFKYSTSQDNEYNKYILSLYTDEDILDIILKNSEGNNIFSILQPRGIVFDRVLFIIKKYSYLIGNEDWSKFILLLKGIRSCDDKIFYTCLEEINIDDNILDKLYMERGLSNRQKYLLMEKYHDDIIRIINTKLESNPNNALYYLQKGSNEEVLNILFKYISLDTLRELLNNEEFVKRRSIGEDFATKLYYRLYRNLDNIEVVKGYLEKYSGNKFIFVKYFEDLNDFLETIGFNPIDFFQSCLNSSYDFIPDMVYIINNRFNEFVKFKNEIFDKYFSNNNVNSNNNLLMCVKNFVRYEELCLSLSNNNTLNEDNIKNVRVLFSREEVLDEKPKHIEDCKNINILIRNNLSNMLDSIKDIDGYKNFICLSIFNASYKDILSRISNYGNTTDLLLLKHYNSNNNDLLKLIDEALGMTSMMEDIINSNDIDALREVSVNILNNLDYILEELNYANYEEVLREMYALEMESNLTKIDDITSFNTVIDKEKTLKYGVNVYDFSDKKYVLLAHVKSDKETIEDLMHGVSSGKRNFISFSAISYRMQSYYWGARNIIFGYDSMPTENFIFSSSTNMGTNRAIKTNSTEVKEIDRKERGVLEVSDTDNNSEILALRKNLIPKYIIIPGNREPSEEELEIAKKYNLSLCYTQEKDEMIENPIEICHDNNKSKQNVFDRDSLIVLKDKLIQERNSRKRKIGIITDPHGMIEPTLAALEDMRKNGITEIYSLGDNIGTGPNPEEVVDLLEAYGVKSIKGNHELYLENLEKYIPHLLVTNSVDEETLNREWTKLHIRDDQLPIINNYDDYIELELAGKKILLCHYLYDYNTNKPIFDIHKYDYIFEGHKHFKSNTLNLHTLRAVGMGLKDTREIGTASYTVLEEDNDDVTITPVLVPYNYKNTLSSANISDINTREKVRKWVGKIG